MFWLTLGAGLPGVVVALGLLRRVGEGEAAPRLLGALVVVVWVGLAWLVRRQARSGFRRLALLAQRPREEAPPDWRRLVRVLGHEMNNSLAPIKSISESLSRLLEREPLPEDWRADAREGLAVISARAEALRRFIEDYTRLARLPEPHLRPVEIGVLVNRVVVLETRLKVSLQPGPDVVILADSDQLEQLLINLVRNAVDAALETRGGVRVGWTRTPSHLEIRVEDDGRGLPHQASQVIPFRTTKPGGSGIGLALSRQIAEGHDGTLTLENRPNASGCVACLRLPFRSGPEGPPKEGLPHSA